MSSRAWSEHPAWLSEQPESSSWSKPSSSGGALGADPVLKKLVEIQRENDWKIDDQVFHAWIRELEKTMAAKKQRDQTVE
ncbi:MAG: hypothetical protein ACYTG0_08540 [Planctomycetota bacterium]